MSNHDTDDQPPKGCTRRRFVTVAGGGLVVLAACEPMSPRVSVGAIDSDDGGTEPPPNEDGGPRDFSTGHNPPPDLSQGNTTPPDLSHPTTPPDLTMSGASCPGGTVNCGPASAITAWSSKRFTDNNTYDFHLCRDSGGLFSVDSSCTHAGCAVGEKSSGSSSAYWYCPCHGARFNFDGTGPTSPAFSPLANYAICIDGSGNVHVDTNQVVSSSQRY